jgi:hypothetical protein
MAPPVTTLIPIAIPVASTATSVLAVGRPAQSSDTHHCDFGLRLDFSDFCGSPLAAEHDAKDAEHAEGQKDQGADGDANGHWDHRRRRRSATWW